MMLKRCRLVVVSCVVFAVCGVLMPPTKAADLPAFQSARNRQYKAFLWSAVRLCPSCTGTSYPPSTNFAAAKARIGVQVSTYKILDQNKKYDWYILGVTESLSNRSGDPDWGWMNTYLQSTGKTKILGSSYSLGKGIQNTTTCKKFPIHIGADFKGVSVGTTVGSVGFCHKGSQVASSAFTAGRKYHATGVTGISSIEMYRYVTVPNGALPTFKVTISTNAERKNCAQWADGYHCWIVRGMATRAVSIGTSPQK